MLGKFEEAKLFHEFEASHLERPEIASLFITSYFNGKLKGLVAVSCDSDIALYSTEGQLIRLFKDAHEQNIVALKLVNEISVIKEVENTYDDKNAVLISGSRDGKFYFWKTLNK